MARNTPKGPIPIDAIMHRDKRTNIPTADAQDFITPEIEEARKIRYARDETLDPQLVWRGKYPTSTRGAEDFENDLAADAPPIYIQEKIDPRVLIENLRRTAARPEDEPELDAFRHLRQPRRPRARRVLQARHQLVKPHDPRRLASGDGVPG